MKDFKIEFYKIMSVQYAAFVVTRRRRLNSISDLNGRKLQSREVIHIFNGVTD